LFTENLAAPLTITDGVAELAPAIEGVGRGADADAGLAGIEEIGDVLGFLRAGLAKAGADDHEIRVFQGGKTAQTFLVVGIDVFALLVPGKDDRAVESVRLGKYLAKHRHRFLRAVFLIASDENDLFALARAVLAGELKRVTVMIRQRKTAGQQEGSENEKFLHNRDISENPSKVQQRNAGREGSL